MGLVHKQVVLGDRGECGDVLAEWRARQRRAESIMLEDMDIYGFFNGSLLDSTMNSVVTNIQVANTVSNAIISRSAQRYMYWTNLQSINCTYVVGTIKNFFNLIFSPCE